MLVTGVCDDCRDFDVQVEYAKDALEEILMRVRIENRADEAASLDVLPQIWARNSWSWKENKDKPSLVAGKDHNGEVHVVGKQHGHEPIVVTAWSNDVPQMAWLFCENDTNVERLFTIEGVG